MAFDDLIRSAVALANRITRDNGLQPTVQHVPVVGRDAHGPLYGPPVERQGIVELSGEPFIDEGGTSRQSSTKITFLQPIPIDLMDLFIVQGQELNVARRSGLMETDGTLFFSEVWLGRFRA